jgi:hypothetical protein
MAFKRNNSNPARLFSLIKIFSFLLMIGLMVLLNEQQENARNKSGRKPFREVVTTIDPSGLAPVSSAIPNKTEGALPFRLISKTNSNFLFVITNCQHFLHEVKYQVLQKRFLKIRPKIHLNFITEYLATIRNKDYK